MLAVGGWLISQLPGGSSVKTDAKKFESLLLFRRLCQLAYHLVLLKRGLLLLWLT